MINTRHAVGWAALALALLWAYAQPLAILVDRWYGDPAYQHGFLVPLFAGFLLWHRRLQAAPASPAGRFAGLALILLAASMLLASSYWYYVLLAPFSLIPCLAGICLWLGGWPKFRWAWPSIAFLFFMIPLPGRLADMLGHPLQRLATHAGTYTLQLVGIPAIAEGNVILLTETKIGVVEACSGLKMLVLFFALSTALVIVTDRKLWEKILLVASAVPIAIISNVARIALTAAANEWIGPRFADRVFHDYAGYFMPPFALGLLWIEMAILSRLFTAPPASRPLDLADLPAGPSRRPAPASARPVPAADAKTTSLKSPQNTTA